MNAKPVFKSSLLSNRASNTLKYSYLSDYYYCKRVFNLKIISLSILVKLNYMLLKDMFTQV